MKCKMRKCLSTISIILCFAMIYLIPMNVVALVQDNSSQSSNSESNSADFSNVKSETEEIGNIVSEDSEQRTENSKTFLLDDGTKMFVDYGEPVHYKNSKNEWVDYDNTLVKSDDNSTYSNKESDVNVSLSKNTSSDSLVSVENDKHEISWNYDDANKSNIVVQNGKTNDDKNDTALDNITSNAEYKNIYNNVDLQCNVTTKGVKENIVLNSPNVNNEYVISYNIGKLIPKLKDDNTIDLYNGKNVVYTISAPYMVDANQKYSENISLEILNHKDDTMQVKLTADKDFLLSSDIKYPVTIDPEISSGQALNTNYSYVGYGTSSPKYNPPYTLSSSEYIRWVINKLPTLTSSQKVIKATYSYSIEKIIGDVSESNPFIIKLHNYKSTSPYYDSIVKDYSAIAGSSDNVSFDITSLVNSWATGESTNNGFILEAKDSAKTRTVNLSIGDKTHHKPMFTMVYKDFTGKEDNLSYHTVSAGSKADVNINDYLGNLVVNQNFYESKAARMPLSLSATYNSFDYDKCYQDSMIGYGWNFSFNQYIEPITDTNLNTGDNPYQYVYIESDRRKHYLRGEGNAPTEWEDDEDLGLKLTKTSSGYILEKDSEKLYFQSSNGKGVLYKITELDNEKNHIVYGRNSSDGYINYIYDSTNQTQATFTTTTINSKKYITTINLPNSRKVNLSYTQSNGKVLLTKVKLPDNSCSNYTYDNLGRLISVKYTKENGSEVKTGSSYSLTYNTANKVTNITERSSENKIGNYLNFEYKADNTTKVTDRNGSSETYTFDNDGTKVSTMNANGYISNSQSSDLTVTKSKDNFIKNYLDETSDFSGIKNNDGYYYSESSNPDNKYSLDTDTKYFGTNAIKIYNKDKQDKDNIIYHNISQKSLLGKYVTFSAYVKATCENNGTGKVNLAIQYKDNSEEKTIDGFAVSDEINWKRISVTAKLPSTATDVKVLLKSNGKNYTTWFDCLQLEEGETVNDYNALKNSDFTNANNWFDNSNNKFTFTYGRPYIFGAPLYVKMNSDENDTIDSTTENATGTTVKETTQSVQSTTVVSEHDVIDTTDAYGNVVKSVEGVYNRVYEVYSDTDNSENSGNDSDSEDTTSEENTDKKNYLSNKYIYQRVNVNAKNVSFVLTGQAQGVSVPLSNENRTFGIALNVYYQGEDAPESHYQSFNSNTTSVQSVSLSVTPENSEKLVQCVDYAFVYGYNSNTMIPSNAMLKVMASPETTSTDSASSPSGDDNTQGTTSASSEVEYGDMLSEELDTSKSYIKSESTYDSKGNYVTDETDENGNTTKYTYDANGNKSSITNGNNVETSYTYDSSDNATSITTGGASNKYDYDYQGNVESISHNNFSFKFNYNEYNKLLSTYVGDSQIVSNIYSPYNGNLLKVSYANGSVISYTYDEYNNVTNIKCNGNIVAKYTYNKNGQISVCDDSESGETTYYYYDCNGNLESQFILGKDNTLAKSVTTDENGNIVEKTEIGNNTRTITSGTDSDGKSFVDYNGLKTTEEKDEFGRTTSILTKGLKDNKDYKVEYTYADGKETNSTSKTVSNLYNTFNDKEVATYSYSYDENGNITQIRLGKDIINKYIYDDKNQLKQEYDYLHNYYINYSLDGNGNIHSVDTQALDRDGLPTGSPRGNIYYYDDKQWCDKLTGVNGVGNITYDEIGNPLNYRDGMSFTWRNGRWLSTTTLNDGTKVTYRYNANGMRTQKKVGSKVTDYYYDSNNNLIAQKTDNATLFFYYDTVNSPVALSYNGKMFYYVKNLQGDIVKILDEDGNEKASYVYNAWGDIISQSDDELASINPLRYRGYVYDEDTTLYYLQTRYYDPTTGRFINADDTAYIGATGTVLSANIFTYCENNPIIKKDINGKVTGVDDVFMLAVLIATVAAIAVVIGIIAFKDSWQILCKYMANSLSSLWQDIWNGFVNFYDWSAKKIKLAIKTCKKYISLYRADSRLRSKLKSKRKNSKRFFTVRMEKNKAPIVGPPIDANVAVSKLRRGFDVITYFRTDALNIANRANGKKSECHQKHDHSFYFSHFHVSLKYIKHHIHSFYVVGG
jgi:RHS repeat-associated protein